MSETLRVLLVVEAAGLAALPLAVLALGRLTGRWAPAFARALGFLVLGFLVWAGGRAGIPNGTGLLVGACFVLALAGLATWPAARRRGVDRRTWARLEVAGIAAFLLAALFNAFEPAVWGTEKPMDVALMAATIVSPEYPPADPWLAGDDVNYYYVGHLAAGVIVRLAGVEFTVGYNLVLAALFAMSAVAAFGLAAGIAGGRRPRLAGAAAVVLLLLAGTVKGGLTVIGHDGPLSSFDWFGASRVIPGTINEFPFFSFLLGDLHAHVIALPVTLIGLGVIVQVAVHGPPQGLVRRPVETAVSALVLGGVYAVNAWSVPLLAALFAAGLAVWIRGGGEWGRAVAHALAVGVLAVVVVLPFALEFEPAARGAGWVTERREISQFVVDHAALYGTLLWGLAALFAARLAEARHPQRVIVWGTAAALVAIFLTAEVDLAGAAILLGLLLVAVGALLSRTVTGADRGMWLLVAGGVLALLAAELVFVRDEFEGGELFRMNTVFKLGFQAWTLLAIAAAVAVAVLPGRLPRTGATVWLTGLAVLVALGLTYSVGASYARKGAFADAPSLDGLAWLERTAPGDPEAIRWLRENAPRDAVVLEAVGEDYSAFGHGRISAYTGRPTVLGWAGHQVQYHHDVGNRAEEVRRMYRSVDEQAVRGLLERYGVTYVVVGPLERTTYGDPAALTEVVEPVFEAEGTAVYRVPGTGAPEAEPEPVPPVLGGGRS